VLGAGLGAKQRTLLAVALSFFTWRSLARDSGLGRAAVFNAKVQATEG
jgi:hypothetical protein